MMASAASWTAMDIFVIESWVLIEDIVDRKEIVRVESVCSALALFGRGRIRALARAGLAERYTPLYGRGRSLR